MAGKIGDVTEHLLRWSVDRDRLLDCHQTLLSMVLVAILAAFTNALILAWSLRPSVSTPLETSTAQGPTSRIASETFAGVSPPASQTGCRDAIAAAAARSTAMPRPRLTSSSSATAPPASRPAT